MKKDPENFRGPIKSDLEFMYFITNLYLEHDKTEYKDEIEKVIKTSHNLVCNKIESKQIDPVIFSIVTELVYFARDYFKDSVNADHINKANIETMRGMLSTLRHSPRFQ